MATPYSMDLGNGFKDSDPKTYFEQGYDAGYAKLLLDPTRGPKFSAGYALGCEHRLADDARADPRWPSDYDKEREGV